MNAALALIVIVLALIALNQWRLHMDVQTISDKLDVLKTKIDAIPAPTTPADLQPIADKIDAISADVDAKFPPA